MRQLNKFAGRHRSQERRFFTEPQFLKFAKPCDEDDLTNLIFAKSDLPTNTTPTEAPSNTEPSRGFGRAKGVSA
jgi:hypothetical protein